MTAAGLPAALPVRLVTGALPPGSARPGPHASRHGGTFFHPCTSAPPARPGRTPARRGTGAGFVPGGCPDTAAPAGIGDAATGAVGTGPGIDRFAVEPVVRPTCVIDPAGSTTGDGTPELFDGPGVPVRPRRTDQSLNAGVRHA